MRTIDYSGKKVNYFPLSLASGKAFCNRRNELKRIHYNLKNKNATLLISPRRYGKTSLALQAFESIQWPYAHIDLYKALSEEDIAHFILNGIGQLLGKIESTPQKLIKVASDFFTGLQLKFAVEKYGLSVELSQKDKRPVDLILAALERLDAHVLKRKKQAILFLDEFQVLAEVVNNNRIEAAIREAGQKTKAVCYVFSGSNRHLIESMFNDKKRPFYHLCDQLIVKRMHRSHYIPYLTHAAQERWSRTLSESGMEVIFEVTELHPYYLNKLCSLIWQKEQSPNAQDVYEIWHQHVNENKSSVEREFSLLRLNQRKLLLQLALNQEIKMPFSKKYALQWSMSSTSIHRAMASLIEKDYVLIDEEGNYKILDPLLKAVLSE